MRKSFTRLFGFLLLNVMMLFSYGLYAQPGGETQSTVELKAPTIGTVCYNASNSYTATISTKDFIKMRSFKLVLKYDNTEFGVATPVVSSPNALLAGGTFSTTVSGGKVYIDWTLPDGTTSVTIGDNAYAKLFDIKFNVLGFPNNSGDNNFDTALEWDSSSAFYYGDHYTGSYQTSSTAFVNGSMNVNVSYPELGTTSVGTTNCNGSSVTLALTNPAFAVSGMTYAFNAQLSNMANWTFGTASSTSVAAPSTVTIRVKDADGCLSHQFTVDVTAPDPLQMAAPTVTDAHCNGELGNIVFNYAGGVAPYVFYVVPSTQMANVLLAVNSQSDASALAAYAHNTANVQMPAGTYYIAMTAGGCTQNLFAASGSNWVRGAAWYGSSVTINEPSAITVAAGGVVTNTIMCNGTSNGTIDLLQSVTVNTTQTSPTNPNPFNYVRPWMTPIGTGWSFVQVGFNFGGPYGYFTRIVPSTTTYISGGAAGTYSATINGTTWKTITNGTTEFTGLAAGTYTITVKDSNGCTTSSIATITQPDAIVFTPAFIDASCASSTTGSIWIGSIEPAESGAYQYEYVVAPAGSAVPTTGWADVNGTTSATSSFTNLPANYYSVWVRIKGEGCDPVAYVNPNGTGNTLPIQAPGALSFTTNADAALDVKCNGDAFTLTVTPAGGVAPYKYMFDNGTYTSTVKTFTPATTTQNTSVVVGVQDALGCTVTRTVVINVAPALVANTIGRILFPSCNGNNDGRAVITVSGGSLDLAQYPVTGYGYSTTGGAPYFPSNTVSIAEGNTIVTVIDGQGCTTSLTVFGGDLPDNTFTVTPTTISCNGTKTGMLNAQITSWNYQNGFNSQPDHHPVFYWATTDVDFWNVASVLASQFSSFNPTTFTAGDYWVGARDEYGCIAGPVKVTIKERPALAFTTTTVDAACYGTYTGQIIINTTGGYSYGVNDDNNIFTPVNNGRPEYYHANSLYALSAPGAPFTDIATYSGYTATKTTAEGKQIIQVQKGIYYIALQDECGTVTSTAVAVGGFDAITAGVASSIETCDTNNATITAKAAGGQPEGVKMPDGTLVAGTATGTYTYTLTYGTWSKTITAAFGENAVFANLEAGAAGSSRTYHLVVKDAKGCTPYEKDIEVKNPGKPVITNVDVTHFTCETSHDGKIKVTVDNAKGTKPYFLAVNDEVSWIPFGNDIAGTTNTNVTTYIATEAVVHYLKVKDSAGCIGNTVSVTVIAPLPLTLTGVDTDVTCAGNGTVSLTAGGGYTFAGQAYNYKLDGGSYQASNGFTNLAAGTHTATVKVVSGSVYTPTTDPTGTVTITYTSPVYNCTASYSFVTKAIETYSYTATATPLCKEGESTGKLAVNVLQGVSTSDGEYYVQLTTTAHPSLTAGITAGVNGTATWTTSTNWVKTKNKKVTFTGMPHAIYSVWISNGSTRTSSANPDNLCLLPTGTEPFNPNQSGPYAYVQSWEILYPTVALTTSATLTQNVTCNGGNDGKYTVSAAGGWGAPYSYASGDSYVVTGHIYTPIDSEWMAQTASGTYTFTGKASTYVVWAKDALGCVVGGEGTEAPFVYTPVNAWRVKVSEPKAINFTATSTEVKCYGDYNGSVTVANPLGFSDNGGSFTVTITGTDALGRAVNIAYTSTNTTSITVPNVPASYTSSPTACVSNPANKFTVTVTDGKGCTSTPTTVAVRQNEQLGVTLEFVKGGLCPGDVSGVVYATAVGGTKGVANGVGCHGNWALNSDGLYRFRLYKDGVVYQAWTLGEAANGNYPKFVVEVGHTWKVEVIDGNGCTAMSNELELVNPDPISIKFNERTCYEDQYAKTEIVVAGGATRTFTVTYKGNTEATARPATAVVGRDGVFKAEDLIFANQVTEQNFYTFYVTDNVGCTASFTRSFVATQIKLEATVAGVGGSASVTVSGGISPYAYAVGSGAKVDWVGSVSGGSYAVAGLVDGANTINVYDNHGCVVSPALTYNADLQAPTATYSPNGTATATADNHPALVITFNENVVVGTGNVKIFKKSENTPIVTIPASAITVSGKTATLTYAGGLDKDTEYYVTIESTVIKDVAGNAFAAVTATDTWTFKTGNKFATPNDPEVDSSLKFKVYPNPFVDVVKIDSDEQLAKVVVTNIAGQVVKEVVNPGNSIQLDELRSGVYFITLYVDSEAVTTVKLLKR